MPTIIQSEPVLADKELVVLDPAEVATGRAELSLHFGAILVRPEGPDWGDAELAQVMADGRVGSVPVDYRLPNRLVTIPLLLHTSGGMTFDQARARLQQKIGLLQREGGWLKRELRDGRKLYLDVVGATLAMGGHSHQALGHADDQVDLILETLPDWYGDEIALDAITETTQAEIAQVLKQAGVNAVIAGDMPARCRIVLNETVSVAQRSLLWGLRSRHYDAATTARLAYDASALTPLDAAFVSGATIKHLGLGVAWTPVLSTDIAVGGPLTHAGRYRVWARAESTNTGSVELRLVWDVGDLSAAAENASVALPPRSQTYLVELGEVNLAPGPGAHRWRGHIQARGAVGGEDVTIRRLLLQPVDESAGRVVAPVTIASPFAAYAARDEFNQKSDVPGAVSVLLTGQALPAGGLWEGGGDLDDFQVLDGAALRVANGDSGRAAGRFAVGGGVTLADTGARVDFSADTVTATPYQGLTLRYTSATNAVIVQAYLVPDIGYHVVAVVNTGAGWSYYSVALDTGVRGAADAWWTLAAILTGTQLVAWLYPRGSAPREPIGAVDLVSAPASGKPGIYDAHPDGSVVNRYYDNFAAWAPDPDAVLFPGRSADLATSGLHRQSPDGAAYGPVSHAIGDLPRIPPSGMEGRPVELLLKTSRGDLDVLPDPAIDPLSAQVFYRPCWLFAPAPAAV